MTDPLAPLSDEDLSALLDGQAEPSVLDRLARDPAARARRDALAAAASAVASEPIAGLEGPQVDALVARALAEAEAPGAPPAPTSDPADAPVAPVVPLAPPRGRRLPPTWLVAAAIVALVAIGLGLVWSGRTVEGGKEDQAQSTTLADADQEGGATLGAEAEPGATSSAGEGEDSATPAEDQASESGPAEPAPEIPSIERRLGAPRYLGAFATVEDLRTAVATGLPTADEPLGDLEVPTDAAFQRCAEQMRVQFSIEDPATAYRLAVVDGVVSMVYEFDAATFDDGEPAIVVTAVRADTCDPYFTIQR